MPDKHIASKLLKAGTYFCYREKALMMGPFPAVGDRLSTKGQTGSYLQHRAFCALGRLLNTSYSGHKLKHKWYVTREDTETKCLPQREEQLEVGLGSV